jgi:hypothetical protein
MTEPAHIVPRDGGSYRRELDGSLTLLEPPTASPLPKSSVPTSSSPEIPESSDPQPLASANRRSRREPQE